MYINLKYREKSEKNIVITWHALSRKSINFIIAHGIKFKIMVKKRT